MTFKMYYLENIPLLLKTRAPCTAHRTGRLTTPWLCRACLCHCPSLPVLPSGQPSPAPWPLLRLSWTEKLLPLFVQPVFPNLARTLKPLGLVCKAHRPLSLTLDPLKQILWGWRPGGGCLKKTFPGDFEALGELRSAEAANSTLIHPEAPSRLPGRVRSPRIVSRPVRPPLCDHRLIHSVSARL